MADYSLEIADAAADIQEAGGVFTLEHEVETTPDPSKPWRRDATSAPALTFYGVLTYYRKTIESQGYTAGSEDSRAILPGDMLLLVAAGDANLAGQVNPIKPRDKVTGVDGQAYVVISVETVAPDGVAILYRVQVRK